jgi:uncharacterized RDD family membrane protein YckC
MLKNAGLMRRFAASIYELLSLIAIWLLCTFVFVMFFGGADTALERFALQVVLWVVTGVYLMACWVKTGQTLAAQAWKIKLVNADGQLLSINQAFMRYVLASISLLVLGLGFLWALVDKDRLFLHDRLSKTRLALLKTD